MLVRPALEPCDASAWNVILIADQNDRIDAFSQQLEHVEFNHKRCQLSVFSNCSQAMEAFLKNQDTALIVLALDSVTSHVEALKSVMNKSAYPKLCVLAVTDNTQIQCDLLASMKVDLVVPSLDENVLMPTLLMGLKRYFDSELLQISQSLLRAMTLIDETSAGIAYLRDLVVTIAKFLGTGIVIIGETDEQDDKIVNTRTVWFDGEYKDNFTYLRSGTPCERVLQCKRVITYPKDVVQAFPEDEMLADMGIESYMGTAIYSPSGSLIGILITMDQGEMVDHNIYEPVLDFFASRIGVELERQRTRDKLSRINEELEEKVILRTRELEAMHKELLKIAHQAGMADIAAGVLHNVGNIFNSIGVASQVMRADFKKSKLFRLVDTANLLIENKENLNQYLTEDEVGKNLPMYFSQLSSTLMIEADKHKENVQSILDNGELIKEVIQNQLGYAKQDSLKEKCKLNEIVDRVLSMQMRVLEKNKIKIEKNYADVPLVYLQEHKFIHVLTNIFKNAQEAMQTTSKTQRQLKITIENADEEMVKISIADTGIGISREGLQQAFVLGYSTKQSGHGIGLHVTSNHVQEMGGKISAYSEGIGACFTVLLPISKLASKKL